MSARFTRLAETGRPPVAFSIDNRPATTLQGDTILVAMLTQTSHVRESEFGDGPRAGFCVMGACQDCWVWTRDGQRVRACSTEVTEGVSVFTREPSHG